MGIFSNKNGDVEAGNNNGQLYPSTSEDPQMRWAFIRKVYTIVCIQLLITIGISGFMFFTPAVKQFLRTMPFGLVTILSAFVFVMIFMCTVPCWSKLHPWNYFFMLIFTLGMAFLVGCSCAFKRGEIIVLAAGLTAIVTVGLTLYTFWAAKRGQDFSFLAPFLLCGCLILMTVCIIRIIFPFSGIVNLVIGGFGALLFSAFIIYDTDNLIKRHSYDEYFEAAAGLYLDIINLFSSLLAVFNEIL